MSDNPYIAFTVNIDITEWIDRAKADPQTYFERQVTEIFLAAIGRLKTYNLKIFLKGGVLMGVVYESYRQTGDIDLTAIMSPKAGIADEISNELDSLFPSVAADLGYPDIVCMVQSKKYFPKKEEDFPKNQGPAIKLKIGYAKRDTNQHERLKNKIASNTLDVDISFKEPVKAIQIVQFNNNFIAAYSPYDLIAEKLRSLLQQEKRNRFRRQDIYDIDSLIIKLDLDSDEKEKILNIFIEKCKAREILPTKQSFSNPEVYRRAKDQWDTLSLEVGNLPDFDQCFSRVTHFYNSLPWLDT